MKKLDRKARKDIQPILDKYKHVSPKKGPTNKFVRWANMAAGHLNVTIGSLTLLDPTGTGAAINFGLAAANYSIARLKEREQKEHHQMNEAGQLITGHEDVVQCLLAIEASMQDTAISLGIMLHAHNGDTRGKHTKKMHELYHDAQKLMPYIDVQSDMGAQVLFEINCEDILPNRQDQPYQPIYHQEFMDIFNQESAKRQQAQSQAKLEAQAEETKRAQQTFQKFKR